MAGFAMNRSRQVPAEETPAFGGIAERFRRAGDLDRAIALCREGLRRFPNQLSARVTLGWALLDKGQYDAAQEELEQVLRRAPDNLAAIRGLAELHERAESSMPSMEGAHWHHPPAEAEQAVPELPEFLAPRAPAADVSSEARPAALAGQHERPTAARAHVAPPAVPSPAYDPEPVLEVAEVEDFSNATSDVEFIAEAPSVPVVLSSGAGATPALLNAQGQEIRFEAEETADPLAAVMLDLGTAAAPVEDVVLGAIESAVEGSASFEIPLVADNTAEIEDTLAALNSVLAIESQDAEPAASVQLDVVEEIVSSSSPALVDVPVEPDEYPLLAATQQSAVDLQALANELLPAAEEDHEDVVQLDAVEAAPAFAVALEAAAPSVEPPALVAEHPAPSNQHPAPSEHPAAVAEPAALVAEHPAPSTQHPAPTEHPAPADAPYEIEEPAALLETVLPEPEPDEVEEPVAAFSGLAPHVPEPAIESAVASVAAFVAPAAPIVQTGSVRVVGALERFLRKVQTRRLQLTTGSVA